MPFYDPKDLLSLIPPSFGLVGAEATSPTSWKLYFLDHVHAVAFMETRPKVISQYPCLRAELGCNLALSISKRLCSPLFPVSIKASRLRKHQEEDFRSTKHSISLALQGIGLEPFYLQQRSDPNDEGDELSANVSLENSLWDLFFSDVKCAIKLKDNKNHSFGEISFVILQSGIEFYSNKNFLRLHRDF